MKMIATYNRGNTLNVRAQPSPNAKVIRTMQKGDEAECVKVEGGWCQLADGFARADLLTVTLADETAEETEPKEAEAPKAEAEEDKQETEKEEAKADDEGAELMKMTNPQLRDLAEKSGIAVKRGATKKELVAAILAADV